MKYEWIGLGLFILAAAAARAPAGSPGTLPDVPDGDLKRIDAAAPAKSSAVPAKDRKVLVIWKCEGFYHGCIPWCNKALETLGRKTGAYAAEFTDDVGRINAETLAGFDALVFNNTTRLVLTGEQEQALLSFLRQGKGMVGIHAATDNFYDNAPLAKLMGGLFAGHPGGAGGTWAVKLDDPGHPLNAAFKGKSFRIRDEIYAFRGVHPTPDLRVLLSLDMDDEATGKKKGNQASGHYAVSWVRTFGEGRIFYCSLGHNNEVFWNAPVLGHYLDGIQYALGDLKADATPVSGGR